MQLNLAYDNEVRLKAIRKWLGDCGRSCSVTIFNTPEMDLQGSKNLAQFSDPILLALLTDYSMARDEHGDAGA